MDVKLSLPFLTTNKIDQLHSRGALLVRGREVCLRDHQGRPTESGRSPISHSFVYTSAAVKVPAYSWGEFPVTVAAVAEGEMMQKEGLLVGDDRFMHRKGLHPVRRRITGCTAEGLTAGAVLNMTDQEVTIPKGTRYGIYALRSEEEETDNTNNEGGASIRGKLKLSVGGKGKIFNMWENMYLYSTWKSQMCHNVEKA